MNAYQWVWQYVRHERRRIWTILLLIVVSAGGTIVVPLAGGMIVDQVITQHHTERLLPLLLLMIGVTLARTLVRYTYQVICERIGQNALFAIRHDLFTKLQGLDFTFFNTVRTGDIMARMTGDTDAIRHMLAWVSYNAIECVLWFFTAIIVMGWIYWPLMLSLVVLTPFIALIARKMSKEAHPLFF